jgi:hypothetical protein
MEVPEKKEQMVVGCGGVNVKVGLLEASTQSKMRPSSSIQN